MNFKCSRFCRGRREEGTRGSKREPKQHTKNTTKTTKPSFFSRLRAKPPKKHVKTAKKAPPGGHNDPQERPRRGRERPKRSQDDPKSAPRAPQEPPRGGLRAALVATWAPPAAQEAPEDLQGRILAPSGVDFGCSGAPFLKPPALVAEPSGEQTQAQGQAQAQAQAQSASAGPRAKDKQAARPQGLKDSGARRDVWSTLMN